MTMDIAQWQKRLEETFGNGRMVRPELVPVLEAEVAYGDFVRHWFHGYSVLMDSFQAFLLMTLKLADVHYQAAVQPPPFEWYRPQMMEYVAIFRAIRSAEILLRHGYSFRAFALLRDVKDQVLVLAAIGNRMTTLKEAQGLDAPMTGQSPSAFDIRTITNRRKKADQRIRSLMIGDKSDLGDSFVEELQSWESCFHLEVHGARFTTAIHGRQWFLNGRELPMLPVADRMRDSLYANTAAQIAWMLLRTLVLLQLKPGAFGNEWTGQWRLLDDSFRFMVEGLKREGKPLGDAIIHLIDRKFPFSPGQSSYTGG